MTGPLRRSWATTSRCAARWVTGWLARRSCWASSSTTSKAGDATVTVAAALDWARQPAADEMAGDLSEDTIVLYSTDNGPHMNTWPDSGMTPFRNEKNSKREGASDLGSRH